MSRTKGQSGEREVAALLSTLTGHDVRRRVRQHFGDADLVGVPGWSIECKRYAITSPGKLAVWWKQAMHQAIDAKELPVLLYRADRVGWRCVWPAGLHIEGGMMSSNIMDCLDADPSTWWRMVEHIKASEVPR
jgi:hypothetical protein